MSCSSSTTLRGSYSFEIFRNENGQAQHRETAHYAKWRDAVMPMMAEARVGMKFTPVAGFDAV
jgi:quinol monooxygenase YgiN